MVDVVVVIPGIEGSALETPEHAEVWPPTVPEGMFGYRRIEQLRRRDLHATRIIRSVCLDVYGSLLDHLETAGFKLQAGDRRRVEFFYDWRRDLLDVAGDLGHRLHQIMQDHGPQTRIRLVCHSMGGLLARACLERPRPEAPAWLAAVDLCVFLATPHEGAPLALARAAGIGGRSEGISEADFRLLANTPHYPAGFELFPASDLLPIWNLADRGTPFAGFGAFDSTITHEFGFNRDHVAAAQAFQAALDERRRPHKCRYFSIVSAFHETVTRFDLRNGALHGVSVAASGDGTVPIRSAAALRAQTAFVSANHLGVAQSQTSHQLLSMLLGVESPDVVVAAIEARAAAATLSISQSIVPQGSPYEVIVAFAPAAAQHGRLVFEREGPPTAEATPLFMEERAWALQVGGAPTRRVALDGPIDLPPGRYRVSWRSDTDPMVAADLVITAAR